VLELASLIVAPALFWFLYHRAKDRIQPEPLLHLGVTYLLGFAAAYLCLKLYQQLGIPSAEPAFTPGYLGYCLIAVGLLEELAKLLPFWLLCMRFKPFDEPLDGIIYASFIALGFASYENFKYMEILDGGAMLARAIASPLTHCMFASIWGYAAGKARHDRRSLFLPLVVGLAIATIAHGVYDFVATASIPG